MTVENKPVLARRSAPSVRLWHPGGYAGTSRMGLRELGLGGPAHHFRARLGRQIFDVPGRQPFGG